MKKTTALLLVLVLFWLTAKRITADRAYRFIIECTTDAEVAILEATNESVDDKKKQLEVADTTLKCVRAKQGYLERLLSDAMGNSLFN